MKDKKDISDKKIDPEVHGFASADTSVQPTPYPRSEKPFIPNGSALPADWNKVQRKRKDISDKKIDPEVHGFASADTSVQPTPYPRSEKPFIPNGSALPAEWNKVQRHRKDIGDKGIDPEVHGFASADTNVQPRPLARANTPAGPHITGYTYGSAAQYARRVEDVANKEIRPDVYVVSNNAIGGEKMYREPFPASGPPANWVVVGVEDEVKTEAKDEGKKDAKAPVDPESVVPPPEPKKEEPKVEKPMIVSKAKISEDAKAAEAMAEAATAKANEVAAAAAKERADKALAAKEAAVAEEVKAAPAGEGKADAAIAAAAEPVP